MSRPAAPRFAARLSDPQRFLRAVYLLDATASGALGVLLLLAPAAALGWLGLPAWLTSGAGWALLPFAALVAVVATREPLPRPAAVLVVGVNVAWVIASALAAGLVAAPPLGTAFIIVQAAAVALFATLQAAALRRTAPAAT